MTFPLEPPVEPMLATLADTIPEGDWIYEPKWDGFRCLVFKDGDDLHLQSRDLKSLDRYFPELLVPLRRALPPRCVVDGEIVISLGGRLEFEALLQRIHPADSRVRKLAAETPASLVVFDLLALDEPLLDRGFAERRSRLVVEAAPRIHLTPATRDRGVALDWFQRFEGAGLDGVVAKGPDSLYAPGKRTMVKIKHQRTADCVVAGFRFHKEGGVGSLLLGLHDASGVLHHVGVASGWSRARRAELVEELAPLREDIGDHPWQEWAKVQSRTDNPSRRPMDAFGAGHASASITGGKPALSAEAHPPSEIASADRTTPDADAPGGFRPALRASVRDRRSGSEQRRPGMQSRWNAGKDLGWEPLRLERVAEVAYDHLQGTRFRHATKFVRWRPDKRPQDCRYDQLEVTPAYELSAIFGSA